MKFVQVTDYDTGEVGWLDLEKVVLLIPRVGVRFPHTLVKIAGVPDPLHVTEGIGDLEAQLGCSLKELS